MISPIFCVDYILVNDLKAVIVDVFLINQNDW